MLQVAWIKSDTKTILAIHTHMVTLNPRLSVTHNGHNTWKLYISNVEPKDSGTYMCQINTDPMMSQVRVIFTCTKKDNNRQMLFTHNRHSTWALFISNRADGLWDLHMLNFHRP